MRTFISSIEIVAAPESFPESVIERIRRIADDHPEIDVEIGGGECEMGVAKILGKRKSNAI